MKRKRKIKKSRVIIVIMIIIIILGGLSYIAFNYIKNNNIELKKEKTIKEIKSEDFMLPQTSPAEYHKKAKTITNNFRNK